MRKNKALAPCPFCGGEGTIEKDEKDGFLAGCIRCDGMIEKWFYTEDEAIAAWNTRADPVPRAVLHERAEPDDLGFFRAVCPGCIAELFRLRDEPPEKYCVNCGIRLVWKGNDYDIRQ